MEWIIIGKCSKLEALASQLHLNGQTDDHSEITTIDLPKSQPTISNFEGNKKEKEKEKPCPA